MYNIYKGMPSIRQPYIQCLCLEWTILSSDFFLNYFIPAKQCKIQVNNDDTLRLNEVRTKNLNPNKMYRNVYPFFFCSNH